VTPVVAVNLLQVPTSAYRASHDAVAGKLTSVVHNHLWIVDVNSDTGADRGDQSGAVAAPGTTHTMPSSTSSRPRFITSICVQGCVQLLGSMFTLPHQLVASSRSEPDDTGAAPTASSSSDDAGATAGAESDTGRSKGGVGQSAAPQHPSAAGQLLSTVLSNLHGVSAAAAGCQDAGCRVPAASSDMVEPPSIAVWVGDHMACCSSAGSMTGHQMPAGTSGNSSLGGTEHATELDGRTGLRPVSTYPICVTFGATSTLRLHLQGLGSEGVARRLRVVAHMQGRLLVDKEVTQDSCIRCAQVLVTDQPACLALGRVHRCFDMQCCLVGNRCDAIVSGVSSGSAW
jgi:hypothetical protein